MSWELVRWDELDMTRSAQVFATHQMAMTQSIWVQSSFKQMWQFWINELDETKDLNTVSLTTCMHPGTIRLGIWLKGMMTLINCSSILGSASEPVSVITIYQDLRAKEAMKITTRLEHLSSKIFPSVWRKSMQRFIFTLFHNLFAFLSSSPCTHNSNTNSRVLQTMNGHTFRSSGT